MLPMSIELIVDPIVKNPIYRSREYTNTFNTTNTFNEGNLMYLYIGNSLRITEKE